MTSENKKNDGLTSSWIFKAVLFATIVILSSGCATVTNTAIQAVTVDSKPQGAMVSVNEKPAGKTPLTLNLHRKSNHDISLTLDGYENYNISMTKNFSMVTLWNFVFGAAGFIGMGVDAANGSMFRLSPNEIYAFMVPTDAIKYSTNKIRTSKNRSRHILSTQNYDTHPHKNTTLAILDFEVASSSSLIDSTLLTDRFSVELARAGVYKLVTQSKMKEILELQNFSASCSTASCAIEVGQLLGVRYMAYGSIGTLGSMYSVNVYIVDIELGLVVAGTSVDHHGSIEQLLSDGMPMAAAAILDETILSD